VKQLTWDTCLEALPRGIGIGDPTCGAETAFPFGETQVFSVAQS